MKVKSLLIGFFALFIVAFSACDDDLNGVGLTIQPGTDPMYVKIDTAYINATTVAMGRVYARSTTGLLGKYEDDIFGTIKSDYLAEFYCPEDLEFKKEFVKLDSVQLLIDFFSFAGDTLAPMGVSVYRVTNPLKRDFYTDVNPADYCNMQSSLGQSIYTINQAKRYTGSTARTLSVDLDMQLGTEFYNEFLKGNNTFQDSDSLKKFFPGVYVTTTFGTGSLIDVAYTTLNIHYQYNHVGGSSAGQDTIKTSVFSLTVTPEVIQLNHVENKNIEPLLGTGTSTGAAYIKSPAGVCPELTLPIKYIQNQLEAFSNTGEKDAVINSAKLSIKGYTEKESELKYSFDRTGYYLLLIDKDSINTFFTEKRLPDYKSSTYVARDATTNTYNFVNIATLINHYKDKELTEDPVFTLIPISISTTGSGTSATLTGIYNYMKPTNTILRSAKEDMRLELVYTKMK